MDLRRLRLLRELRARGTIAAVAEALSYSPSAVSQQLAELQREAGVVLFERAGRRLRLTDAAHMLARHADILLARMEQAEADLAVAGGSIAGVVRVASFQTAAISLLPGALAAVATAHPGLRVEVVEQETAPALGSLVLQEVDLVVGVDYEHIPAPRPAGVIREDLFAEPLRIALPAGHRLARSASPVSVAALADAAWAAGYPGTGHAALVNRVATELGGFDPDIRHRANDLLIMAALVRSGHVVTLLPDMASPPGQSGVVTRDLAEGAVSRGIFLATRAAGAARPALSGVRAAVAAAASEAANRP